MPSDTDLTREAQKIWNALRPMVREEARKAALPAVRAKKMTVMTPPNGKTVGVAEPFGPTLDVPYSTAISHLVVGDSVWVQYFYDNASTMFVVCRGDGQTFGGEYPLTVAQGGTGASDAASARASLSVPSVTGSGATGTWPISITGNAATVGGKNIDNYLPLTGGTLTGPLTLSALNAGINIQRGNLRIGGDANHRGIAIYGAAGAPSLAIRNTGARFTFDQYANGSTGGERYLLPIPDAHDADVWQSILTTKPQANVYTRLCPGVDLTTNPSVQSNNDVIRFYDVNSRGFGYIGGTQYTNGQTNVTVSAYRTIDGTTYYNGLTLGVRPDETRVVAFSDVKPWLLALGLGTNGELPVTVAQGGTGASTLASGEALIGNGANAVTTRSITNLTSDGTVTANTNLITANTLVHYANNRLGSYLPLAGGTLSDNLYISRSSYPALAWKDDSGAFAALIGNNDTHRIWMRTFNPGLTHNWDLYFPAPTDDATANAAYSILTTATLNGVTGRSCMVGQNSNTGTKPWYKVAECRVAAANSDRVIVFLVEETYVSKKYGILRINVRTNGSAIAQTQYSGLSWLADTGFTNSDFVLVCPTTANPTFELWTSIDTGYQFRKFTVLSEGARGSSGSFWTLFNAASAGQAESITTAGTQITPTGSIYAVAEKIYGYCFNDGRYGELILGSGEGSPNGVLNAEFSSRGIYVTSWDSDNAAQLSYRISPNSFVSGDTYAEAATTVNRNVLPGIIAGSNKQILFRVSVPRLLTNVSQVSVTSLTGWIASMSGIVKDASGAASNDNTNWLTQSGITVSAVKKSENTVIIRLTCSSTLGNAVNGVCSGMLGFTLSFS